MIEGDFDTRTLTMMNAALDRVCEHIPRGEEYAVRKRIAKQIIKCAKSGKTTLSDLTAAGQRALIGIATSRNVPTPEGKVASREGSTRIA
jgi:predicted MarR family transcription regulator